MRLPYSIHWLSVAYSGCSMGTMLPGKHCGQVGQPRPDPVTRTMEPVTPIPACVMMAAMARARCRACEGYGKRPTSEDNCTTQDSSSHEIGRASGRERVEVRE